MTKKGTGWVPDFPDVKDYTLNGVQTHGLISQVQTDDLMEAHEETTGQIVQALKLLKSQSQTSDKNNKQGETSKKLEDLIQKLDKKAAGGVFFANTRLHKTLKQGMSDPEVLKIKKYLQSIYKDFLSDHPSYNVFDSTFDELTKSLIEDFQANRNLLVDGIVEVSTMEALWWTNFVKENPTNEQFGYGDYDQLGYGYCYYLNNKEEEKKISLVIDQLQESQTELEKFNGQKFEEIEQPLRLAVERMKTGRQQIRDFLEQNEEIKITPIVERWLNYLDEKPIENELARLKDESLNSETVFLGPVPYDASSAIKKLINKICDIPCALLVPPKLKRNKKIENIESPVPEQLFESILNNLFSTKEVIQLRQLIKPVTWSEFQVVPSGTELGYYVESSYIFKQRDKAAKKLNDQLNILGIALEPGQADTWETTWARIYQFEKSKGISLINSDKVLTEKSMSGQLDSYQLNTVIDKNVTVMGSENINVHMRHYYTSVFEMIAADVQSKINQFISPIVKSVFQIIMPLGMQNNFEKAVKQGLETFETLSKFAKILRELAGQETIEHQKDVEVLIQSLDELIQAETADNTDFLKKVETVDIVDNHAYLTRMSLSAAQEIFTMLDSEPESFMSQKMWDIVSKYQLTRLTDDELKELEKNGMIDKSSSEQRSLLELLTSEMDQACQADLRVPIVWDLYQRIKRENDNKADKSTDKNGVNENGPNENRYESICLRLPDFVDLSLWCSPIEDQGSINSCTAHAGVALTEYFAKKAFGKYTDVSPLFLYKTARNLMQREGDSGASVRETMKAMVLFGIPPEEHWPYIEENYDDEPTTFCYSFAQNYQALKYFRLDYAGIAQDVLLIQVKAVLLAGFPCMFGFTLYTSIHEEANVEKGYIPYPSKLDKMEGGHAVVAVGYDDNRTIPNADGRRSEGAILIRNSWGADWGRGGYGWLPYDYILAGLTADWWSILQSEWFESGKFGVGASNWKSKLGERRKSGTRG